MAQRRQAFLDLDGLWSYALRALGGRAHSVNELKEKLNRRAACPEEVEEVLSRLKRYGYLDDRRFAESFTASRLGNEGFGKMRVLRDLRRRRIAPPVAEKAVQSAYQEVDEVALIEAYLERKYRKVRLSEHLSDPRKLAAVYRRLRLAGFSSGNSIRVLKRFAAEAEELESLESPEEDAGR